MKRIIIALLFFGTVSNPLFCQRSESEIALKEYFADAEFFLAQEFFKDALNDYIQVYKRGYQDNYNMNYKIGICYLNISGQKDKAIDYLEVAREGASDKYRESTLKEKYAPIDVHLYLGNAYRVNNRLKDAIDSYNTYNALLDENEQMLKKYVQLQIEACNIASEFMSNPIELEFVNMGELINSSSSDYRPLVSGNGSVLVFMRSLPFYEAIFYSKFEEGVWTNPENITPQIMSDGDHFVSCLSYDGNVLYLSKEDEFNSDIYSSKFEDNRWSKSSPLASGINTKYWESHASISSDGKTLYFTSNRKGGAGEMDIYMATLSEDSAWTHITNLGPGINTDLNEDTPFITTDGKTLYFSSQGFVSMGGYDIVKATGKDSDEWSIPQNVGFPLNSTDDDLFYVPWNNGEEAYMARVMDEGYGEMDIYKVLYPVKVDESIVQLEEVKKVAEPEVVQPEEETAEPEISVPVVVPIRVKQITLELQPALFGFDEYSMSAQGKKQLDILVGVLNEELELTVLLIGFTDALGPESYNLRLSESRAKSALKYLASQGIDASRLQAIGKGETNFIAPNTKPDGSDDPENRKYNRRVEFEIEGADSEKLMIKRIDPVPKQHQENIK